MKKTAIALGIIGAALALPAGAQGLNMSAFYVGATLGQSEFKDSCDGIGAGVSCDEKDTAWRLLGGYQFNRNFAAELGYHNFGETKASAGGISASIKSKAWELVGIGSLPVANQFSLYGKLGGYRADTELTSNFGASGKDTNTGWTYGFGAQWDPMAQLGVRVEWQQYRDVGGDNSGKGEINVLSVGGIWRFR
ncbi:MAG TPA: outer membrane beta-barrel protein [Burkholderiales bacterium]